MGRLMLIAAFAANVLVLVVCTCTGQTSQDWATSVSSASTRSSPSSSYSSSTSSATTAVSSKPKKCHKIKKCPKNEEFSYCPQSIERPQYCSEEVTPSANRGQSKKPCKEGCVCIENFLRADNRTCIPADQCPLKCGKNEVVDNCPHCIRDNCPRTEEDTFPTPCPAPPQECLPPICKCAPNYLRDANGTCINNWECPPFDCSHKINENFTAFPPICRSDDCSDASPTGECPPEYGDTGTVGPYYNPKCICIEGYWRLDGVCVPYAQCPGVCPANETYSTCIQAECRALNCTQKDQSVPCIRMDPAYCDQGCVCLAGYLRNQFGFCVLENECEPHTPAPPTCGTNEVVDYCPTNCMSDDCPRTEEDTFPRPCPPPREECQPPACKCAPNYQRAINGTCINNWECPPFNCSHRPNEQYAAYPPVCRSDDCRDASPTGECPPGYGDTGTVGPYYNPKCICIEGYWRLDGVCVPYAQCPGVCPANETYSTCIQAECRALNCTQKDQSLPCIRMDPADCERGCVCLPGYLRNQFDICVLENECQPPCRENEELVQCIQGVCRAKYCYERGQEVPCPDIPPEECDSGCICKEGFLRASDGRCVCENQCEANPCQRYEEWSTCVQALCRPLNCSDLLLEKPQYCPIVAEEDCEAGCVCQPGYVRDEYGNCVLEQQCYSKCGLNEQYDGCANAVCKPEYCTQKGMPVPCPPFHYDDCRPGCLCRDNYLRNESGICVPEEECTTTKPPICPPYEEWSTCAQAICRAQNCTERGKPVACPMILEGFCEEACVCEVGYLRNKTGNCIPEEQCPCSDNEVRVDCLKNCNTEYCLLSADEAEVCYPPDSCVPGCECRFNYKRHPNGTCIPIRDCPPFDCSGKPNETYVACPPYCPTDECSRPRLYNYCPYKIGIVLECKPKCQCMDGYGRHNGTCVAFEECPNLCPDKEEYSSCVEQTCRPQNCEDRDLTMETCPTCKAEECQRGCVCQENYYRNNKGKCVSYDECGGPMCPDPYQVYVTDFKECPPNICESLVAKYKCDGNQTEGPGCRCQDGYLRTNQTGPCVKICDCPQMKGSPDCP